LSRAQLPLDDRQRTRDVLQEYAAVGATRVTYAGRYADTREFAAAAEALHAAR
jgi:hypothetical protein